MSEQISHRTREEIRRFDSLKLGVLLLLMMLLALVWYAGRHLQPAELAQGGVAATERGDLPAIGLESDEAQEPLPAPTLAAPSIDALAGGLAAGNVTLSGTAGPGAQVAVLADDRPVGVAIAGVDGTWSMTVDMLPGEHSIRVQTLDNVGSVIGEIGPVAVTVAGNSTPPSLNPPVGGQTDATSGTAAMAIAPGPITWTGQGDPGTQVEMVIDGLRVGVVEVDTAGNWSLPINMPVGNYSMKLNTLDASGAIIASSDPVRIVVSGDVTTGEAATIAAGLSKLPDQFTILEGLLQTSGMAESLPVSGPFTLFAPTDAAFARLPQRVIDDLSTNPQALSRLLQFHILSGVHTTADLLAAPPTTLNGFILDSASHGDEMTIGGAQIVAADVPAAGGIIQAVDRVLLPPLAEDVQPPMIDDSGVHTFAGTSLTIVGTAEPNRTMIIEMNGEPFGQPALVDADGNWSVNGEVAPGDYEIIAYMLDATNGLEAISQPVILQVTG